MKETRMKINNYDIVISYDERKNVYELWIDDRLCIELTKEQISIFTTFINSSIEFISKIKYIIDEETDIKL
jgi:hypothetical protein